MSLNVALTMRITPANIDVDLDKIKEKLGEIVSKYGKVYSAEKKPIAFGLNAIEAVILLNDKKGGGDEIEEELQKLEIVGGVDVLDLTLI